ncbi:MAG TPA: ABC transporter permease [Terriglobales bacterium]|nr:ABC transporter permease [Terriglobales bacterium]
MVLETLPQDLRFGVRTLRKNPGFSIAALIMLALGIGGNVAIFTVSSAYLLKPLPYHDPGKLVLVEVNRREGNQEQSDCCTLMRYEEIRDHSRSFSGVAAVTSDSLALSGHGEPEQVSVARISPNFFDVLGVRPQLGRAFSDEEGRPEGKPVVMISDSLWHTRFGGDPGIVGQTVNLDDTPSTIVGVLPRGVQFPFLGPAEVWTPRYFELSLLTPQHIRSGVSYLTILARLAPTASISSATAEMNVLNSEYARDNPKAHDVGPNVAMSVVDLRDRTVANIRPALLLLSGAVGLVLLIACANIASLLLSRALARSKEIAVRAALGARRGVLIQQLLTESLILSLLGGALGLGLSYAAVSLLARAGSEDLPQGFSITTDLRVLVFVLAISLFTGLLFGLFPALQLSKINVNAALRDEGRGSTGGRERKQWKSALVVGQVALSMLLLISAGLLVRSFSRLLTVDPGFDPRHVLTMDVALPTVKYGEAPTQIEFFDELTRRVSALPGVSAAAVSAALPLTRIRITPILAEGQPEVPITERPFTVIQTISPGFFDTMRISLRAGRAFTAADNAQAPKVLIVNEALARRYWPNQNPVGKHVIVGRGMPAEVVGVAANAKNNGLALPAEPQLYLPFPQLPWANMYLLVRTAMDPLTLVPQVRAQLASIDPDQPITHVQTAEELMDSSRAQPRFMMMLLTIFSVTALVLAVIGIYGVLAYSVAQRRQEMGIRLALGANKADILRLILGQGLALTLVGIGIGLLAALAVTRVLSGLLYAVGAHDGLTFIAAPLIFATIGLLASYVPARRASLADPAESLR